MPTRRSLAVGAAAALVWGTYAARAAAPARIAVLDWGLAETCLALGCTPVGVPAPAWYDRYAVEPSMPAGVADVGLLFTPNFELLQELAPDAIVVPPMLAPLSGHLERIAPLIVAPLVSPGPDTYGRAAAATRALAKRLGREEGGRALVAETGEARAAAAARLRPQPSRPVCLVTALDDRHLNLFGPNSLQQDVAARLGLPSVWTGADAPAGEFITIGADRLVAWPDATIVAIAAGSGDQLPALAAGEIWRALPAVKAGRVLSIDPVLGAGGLPPAVRLARLLADALTA